MHCENCGAEFDDSDIDWDFESDGDDIEGQCPECGSKEIHS